MSERRVQFDNGNHLVIADPPGAHKRHRGDNPEEEPDRAENEASEPSHFNSSSSNNHFHKTAMDNCIRRTIEPAIKAAKQLFIEISKLKFKVAKMGKSLAATGNDPAGSPTFNVLKLPQSLQPACSIETMDGVFSEAEKAGLVNKFKETGEKIFITIFLKTKERLDIQSARVGDLLDETTSKIEDSIADEIDLIPRRMKPKDHQLRGIQAKLKTYWEEAYFKEEYQAGLIERNAKERAEATAAKEAKANEHMDEDVNQENIGNVIEKKVKQQNKALLQKLANLEKKLSESKSAPQKQKQNSNKKPSNKKSYNKNNNKHKTSTSNAKGGKKNNHNNNNNASNSGKGGKNQKSKGPKNQGSKNGK